MAKDFCKKHYQRNRKGTLKLDEHGIPEDYQPFD
jgi:hypothetical protein